MADMRTIGTAIGTYATDMNYYRALWAPWRTPIST
jgi:hypothetical protein